MLLDALANGVPIPRFQGFHAADALGRPIGRAAILSPPSFDSLLGGINAPILQSFVQQIRRLHLGQRWTTQLRAMDPLQVSREQRHGRAIL